MTLTTAAPRINTAIVGVEVGPLASVIDARWLMAYAAGLGETDPRYFDTLAASGPLAHPVFAVCYEWPLALAIRARALDEAIAPLGVHATHRLVVHQPTRAGETVLTTARVTAVEPRRAGTLVTIRFTTVDASGAPLTTTDHGSIYRGVECAGPAAPRATDPASAAPGDVRWTETVAVGAEVAHVYTECARIWNPIHTDIAVARAAGLPGLILHGTATLALAVSRVVARDLAGEAAAVREVSARFTGMVRLPSRFTVRGRGTAGGARAFDAVDEAGVSILSEGVLRA